MRRPAPTGVLPVDKPVGPTSHDVVGLARRGLGTRKVGHTGTLDPFASGLLLLCVGAATRLSPFLTGLDKSYVAEALLGITTDTLDREGEVVERRGGGEAVPTERILEALRGLTGAMDQTPPAYSAKKVAGEAAHRRVRRGESVTLPPAAVTVHRFELIDRDGARLRLRVDCSSGTYIRALARDLGEVLGTGAHLTELRRRSVGRFEVEEAVSVDALDRVPAEAWITPAEALERAGVPLLEVDPDARGLLAQGRTVACDVEGPGTGVRAVGAVCDGELLAVGEAAEGRFQPRRVFVTS